jgi:hypothetical protein
MRKSRALLAADATTSSSSSAVGSMVRRLLTAPRRGRRPLCTARIRFFFVFPSAFLVPLQGVDKEKLQDGACYISLVCLSVPLEPLTGFPLNLAPASCTAVCLILLSPFFTALWAAGTYGVEMWDDDELERICKEPIVAKSSYYSGSFLEGLRKPQPGEPVLQLRIEPSTTCVQV